MRTAHISRIHSLDKGSGGHWIHEGTQTSRRGGWEEARAWKGKGGETWCRKGKVMEGDADGMGEGERR